MLYVSTYMIHASKVVSNISAYMSQCMYYIYIHMYEYVCNISDRQTNVNHAYPNICPTWMNLICHAHVTYIVHVATNVMCQPIAAIAPVADGVYMWTLTLRCPTSPPTSNHACVRTVLYQHGTWTEKAQPSRTATNGTWHQKHSPFQINPNKKGGRRECGR